MFVNEARLPHLLAPSDYFSEAQFQLERERLFEKSWFVVGVSSELARPGDFITTEILGVPIQVRNHDGRLGAYLNVCAHRHCLLTSCERGNSERMRCQYHGWEYGEDGRTAKIPEPKNFVPIERDEFQLSRFRVEACGQLVFVSIGNESPPLGDFLGDFYPLCAERFGDGWESTLCWNPTYNANWKVPIENSLEAYHVPCIHPQTFREAPEEKRCEHVLLPRRTAFGSKLPFSVHSKMDAMFQRFEGTLIRWLSEVPTRDYWQHHVFPHLLFSFTDAISLSHCVIPTGPTTCRAVVRQMGRVGTGTSAVRKKLAGVWGRLSAGITKQILVEDMSLFADIQRGLEHSPHSGILGRCEERIHAFQAFVQGELK